MKTIGIKLADGSFYPIMQEGSPEKKQLNLTTVKDNQTTVQVDLYRSETGTMEDAEYVDTLEITNLVQHPNGEPDINLDISLDENNELKAELHDPETGSASTSDVNLISKPADELDQPSDIALAELDESLSNQQIQESFDTDEDLTFDPNSLNVDSIIEETETAEVNEESDNSDMVKTAAIAAGTGLLGAATAMALANKDKDEDQVEEFSESSEAVETDNASDDISDMDFSIPDDFDSSESFETTEVSESSEAVEADNASDDGFSIPDDSLFNNFDESDSMESTASSGLDFSDILDEETKEGHASSSSDSEVIRKKTKTPVIICIICAVICIAAVILILFRGCSSDCPETEEVVTTPVATEQAKPDYNAKENEIVVAPAEEVVPEVPKKPAPENKNITYKIKWGDTLWDISKSYYNNPWKYRKISNFNGIKNPDHIISGTKIVIPAE